MSQKSTEQKQQASPQNDRSPGPPPVFEQIGRSDHLVMPEDHMDELYNSPNPLVRFVHGSRLDWIADELPAGTRLAILDAGCGEGHLLERLYRKNATHHYFGVDLTEVGLEKARKRCPFAEFRQANLLQTGLPDAFFDVVICTEVLEHVYEYKAVIQEFKRILKRGGFLIVTFPNEFLWTVSRFFLGRKPVKVPDHVNAFTPARMKSLVNLPLVRQRNMPFGLPFWISLGSLMRFQKGGAARERVFAPKTVVLQPA